MIIDRADIRDIVIFEPKIIEDDRGYFFESYRQDDFTSNISSVHFIQENQSKSAKGTFRGLHYQLKKPQGKLVRVIKGSVQDVIVDIRQKSPTFGKSFSIILSSKNNLSLWVPPGFAHGFLSLSEGTQFFYKVTNDYSPENERTLLWNDPELNIDWQTDNPILSEKDVEGKVLKECTLA